MTNVSRIVALGGSIRRILRVSEARGAPHSARLRNWVGPLKEPCSRASSEVWRLRRLEVTNVSRIVSLGGSIYRILRVPEAPGGPDSNGLSSASESPLKPLHASSEVWISGGLEILEAGSDGCLEDRFLGKLHLSYSTRSGGSRRSRL